MTSSNQKSARHTCVVGLGWGDEGKGKITDILAPHFTAVVRFNGGANAGHTVCIGDQRFALHLLPSGILHPGVQSIIGPGVVVDPLALVKEIGELAARGVEVGSNLAVSDRAHLVMPYHHLEDRLSESALSESNQIGTTGRGIGPCYADKMLRNSALRMTDLLHFDRIERRLPEIVKRKKTILAALHDAPIDLDAGEIIEKLRPVARQLQRHITDTTHVLHDHIAAGRPILFEAANGTLLDIDHGTYPFVTSSSTTANGIATGAGVPAATVGDVIGVVKAYATRVGRGPFMSELADETGDRIRERGNEYGTTTGRPRRCGWFDAVATAYAVRLSGVTSVALMHLDTLSGFDVVGICTAYRLDGKTLHTIPADPDDQSRVEPVIETMPGWREDLSQAASRDGLPQAARGFVDRIESLIGAPVGIISVGPKRSQTITVAAPSHASLTPAQS